MNLLPCKKLTVIQSNVRINDPHLCSDTNTSLNMLAAMYEALVRRDESGSYLPSLAKSWTVEDDGRSWTFKLRLQAYFHNGDMLKAQDVVASLDRVCDPSIGGAFGTEGVYCSYIKDAVIKAIDDHTVNIATPEPMADLLDILVKLPIAPQRALGSLPDIKVGSGPYSLVESSDELVVMEAFEKYWGAPPPVKEIHWLAEPDEQKRIAALLTGEADIIAGVTQDGKRAIEAAEQAKVVAWDSSMCIIFMCNALSGACTDTRVRQALNYALNVSEIIDKVKGGAAKQLNGPLTPLHFGYDPSTPAYPYDTDKARTLLAQAGYADGLHIVMDIPTTSPDEAPHLARLMAKQYSKVGITVKIKEFTDREGYAKMVRAKKIDDICCFDSSPLSTYRVLREKIHSGFRGPWWQGYSNPEVDTLIDHAQSTVKRTLRRDLYRRAYRMIRNDAPWIFLYRPIYFWGIGPRAHGWTVGIDGLIRLV